MLTQQARRQPAAGSPTRPTAGAGPADQGHLVPRDDAGATHGTPGAPFRELRALAFRSRTPHWGPNKRPEVPPELIQHLTLEFASACPHDLTWGLHNCLVLRHSLPMRAMQAVFRNPLLLHPSQASHLPPRDLFTLLRALSFQSHCDHRRLAPYFQQLQPHLAELPPSELVGLLVALSSCSVHLPPLLHALVDALLPVMPDLTIQDLYSLSSALTDLRWYDRRLVLSLTDHALPLLPQLHSTFRLARLLSYLTHQGLLFNHPTALRSILDCIQARAADFDGASLPSLLTAIGGCPAWHGALEAAILPIVVAHLPSCPPSDLAVLLREARNAHVHPRVRISFYAAVLKQMRSNIHKLHKPAQLVHAVHTAGGVPGEAASAFLAAAVPRVMQILPQCKPDQATKLFQAYSTSKNPAYNTLLLDMAAVLTPLLPHVTEASLILCLQALPSLVDHMMWALAPAGNGLMRALVEETMRRVSAAAAPSEKVGHDLDRLALAALTELPRCGLLQGSMRTAVVFRLMQADASQLAVESLSRVILAMEASRPNSAAPALKVELLQRLAATAHYLRPAHVAELLYACQDELNNPEVPPLQHAIGLAMLRQLHEHTLFTLGRTLLTLSRQDGDDDTVAEVLDKVGDRVAEDLLPAAPTQESTARFMGRLLSAYMMYGRRHPALFDAVAEAVLRRLLPLMSVGTCAYMLRAFAHAGHVNEELFARVAEHLMASPRVGSWKGYPAVVAEAYAIAGHRDAALMECLVDEVLRSGYFTARHAASMVQSFARLGCRNDVLLDEAAGVLQQGVLDVSLESLHAVVEVYSRWEHPMQHVLKGIARALLPEQGRERGEGGGKGKGSEETQGSSAAGRSFRMGQARLELPLDSGVYEVMDG